MRVSAIETVQTYLTHQAQAIQSHLITILPGLIQGEVRTQYSQLARQIGNQITSIREEFEEGERVHHRSQQPNNRDEGDEDEGAENEDIENEISGCTRKYKKQVQALRVSIIQSCSP